MSEETIHQQEDLLVEALKKAFPDIDQDWVDLYLFHRDAYIKAFWPWTINYHWAALKAMLKELG